MDSQKIVKSYLKCTDDPRDFIKKYEASLSAKSDESADTLICTLEKSEIAESVPGLLGILYISVASKLSSVSELTVRIADSKAEMIKDALWRNHDRDGHDRNFEVYAMQLAYICMMYLSDEKMYNFASLLFQEDTFTNFDGKKKTEKRSSSNRLGNIFRKSIRWFPKEILWEESYCKIVQMIAGFRGETAGVFLYRVEKDCYRKVDLVYYNTLEAKDYFEMLISRKEYGLAKVFFDRIDIDTADINTRILMMDADCFIQYLYTFPSPELISYGKFLKKRLFNLNEEDYSYYDWKSEVQKYNNDTDIKLWLEITCFYHYLKEAAQTAEQSHKEEDLIPLLDSAKNYRLYDTSSIDYKKQLREDFADAFNSIKSFGYEFLMICLKKIESINLFSYRLAYEQDSKTFDSYRKNKEVFVEEYYDRGLLQDLFDNTSLENAIYIFLNTHLKFLYSFNVFLDLCRAKANNDNMFDYFSDYRFRGRISGIDMFSHVEDRVFLKPIGLKVDADQKSRRGEDDRLLIRADKEWTSRNIDLVGKLRGVEKCLFSIEKINSVGIYATNIEILGENDDAGETINRIIGYLRRVQEEKVFSLPDNDNNLSSFRYIIKYHRNIDERILVAKEIVVTCSALAYAPNELDDFLYHISRGALQSINEFKYVKYDLGKRDITVNTANDLQLFIRDYSNKLMLSKQIEHEQKRKIFFNTIFRKYCRIEDVYDSIFDIQFTKYNIAGLTLNKVNENTYWFCAKSDCTILSDYEFIYQGVKNGLKTGNNYIVRIDSFNAFSGYFLLADIDMKKDQIDPGNDYIRLLYDIKKIVDINSDGWDKLKTKFSAFEGRNVIGDRLLRKFVFELDSVFRDVRHDYNIEYSLKALKLIKATNPLLAENLDEMKFKRLVFDYDIYLPSYEAFLREVARENKYVSSFIEIYFQSYLRFIIPFEKLIGDLKQYKSEEEINWILMTKGIIRN